MATKMVKINSSSLLNKLVKLPWQIPTRTVKQNTCYLPVCGIQIDLPRIDSVEQCKIGKFLEDYYFAYEPVMVANEVPIIPSLVQFYKAASNQGHVLYALTPDEHEVLGMVIARVTKPTTYKDTIEYANKIRDKKISRYLNLFASLDDKVELYKKYMIKNILNIDVLVTHMDFRRRQVAETLLQGVIQYAERKKYPLIRFNSTSHYSSKAAKNVGFAMFYSVYPKTIKDNDGVPWLPAELCPPHKQLEVYIKDLRSVTSGEAKAKEIDPCKVSVKFATSMEDIGGSNNKNNRNN